MRLAEKILPLVTLVILGAGTLCYTMNLDIYRSIENMNPAGGYAEFVNKLGDEEFVVSNCSSWEDSQSWILRDLYNFLTNEDAELNAAAFVLTQAVVTFAFYYSFACIPFIIITFVLMRKRRKEVRNDKRC